MIYIDTMGHLKADTEDELHTFAEKLGHKRSWYQDHNPRHPHYDVIAKSRRALALKLGAKLVSPREMVGLGFTLDGSRVPRSTRRV